MTKVEFHRQMERLSSFSKKLDSEFLSVYYDGVKNIPIEDFEYCMTVVLQNDSRFPNVARIREILHERKRYISTDREPKHSIFFTFRCPTCETNTSARRSDLEVERARVTCCGKDWPGKYLRDAMTEAEHRGETFVVLSKDMSDDGGG